MQDVVISYDCDPSHGVPDGTQCTGVAVNTTSPAQFEMLRCDRSLLTPWPNAADVRFSGFNRFPEQILPYKTNEH